MLKAAFCSVQKEEIYSKRRELLFLLDGVVFYHVMVGQPKWKGFCGRSHGCGPQTAYL
jgi:hypothetical protein